MSRNLRDHCPRPAPRGRGPSPYAPRGYARVLGACVALLVASQPTAGQAPSASELVEQFLREAPAAHAAYQAESRSRASVLKSEVRQIRGLGAQQVVEHKHKVTRKRDGTNLLYVQEQVSSAPGFMPVCEVLGRNSRYGFALTKGSPADAWVVHRIDQIAPDLEVESRQGTKLSVVMGENAPFTHPIGPMNAPNSVRPWEAILRSPECKILRVDAPAADRFVLRFEHPFKLETTVGPQTLRITHTVRFNPARWWRTEEFRKTYDLPGGNSVQEVAEIEFDGAAQLPYARRSVHHRTAYDGKQEILHYSAVESKTEITRPGRIPETEFSLSAFGFKEPEGAEVRPGTPRWVWWALVPAALFGLGLLVRRLVTRRAGLPVAMSPATPRS